MGITSVYADLNFSCLAFDHINMTTVIKEMVLFCTEYNVERLRCGFKWNKYFQLLKGGDVKHRNKWNSRSCENTDCHNWGGVKIKNLTSNLSWL